MRIKGKSFAILCGSIFLMNFIGYTQNKSINNNKPEREKWLQEVGFGMFIHWGIDTQLGTVISHSLVGSSPSYADKYIKELPTTFNPKDWDAEKVVILAKNAGMKYIMFTTKHHSGFCMWDTKTTDFNVMNTPYKKDLVADLVAQCRKYGIAVGFYFSTEDFVYSYQQGIKDIKRENHWEHTKSIHPQYSKYILNQTKELMTNYGPVDLFFLDSQVMREEVKSKVWELQPNCLITRGAIHTPEQFIPGGTITSAWESNMTMGTQWNYKPTNEFYKSGSTIIKTLIEARAKGGTFLLNIGPNQWGNLNEAQQGRLMEVAAWNFVNNEAIVKVSPWIVSNEEDIWLTTGENKTTVYAYITNITNWKRGERKKFYLGSVKTMANTKISVLGQTGNLVEYMPDVDGKAYYKTKGKGTEISVVRAQRIYNNHLWPNPVVIKLENVVPALEPSKFITTKLKIAQKGLLKFSSDVLTLGDGKTCELGFEYRPLQSSLEKGMQQEWKKTNLIPIVKEGKYIQEIENHFYDFLPVDKERKDDKTMFNASVSTAEIEYRAVLYQDGFKIIGNSLNSKHK